jgi:hypothetical protein
VDAEALSQSGDGPHPLVGVDRLGVKRRAVGLQEMLVAAETPEWAPPSAIGITVGADVTETDPAVRRTRRRRTEGAGRIDLTVAASYKFCFIADLLPDVCNCHCPPSS